jgi:hypothetical protein
MEVIRSSEAWVTTYKTAGVTTQKATIHILSIILVINRGVSSAAVSVSVLGIVRSRIRIT